MTTTCKVQVLGWTLGTLNNFSPFIKEDINGTVGNLNKVIAQIDSLGRT